MNKIEQVPTNIITGALGAGKTTLIQALLKQKPNSERWAVLVNEFGEIGIDGTLLAQSEDSGIFIREVPGGCMCCTSGLPMQIALNFLLAKAKPHRLLIEPTGLGHPKEVLQTLTAKHYQEVLDVRATLTLIDARKLSDKRWRTHQTFQEQLLVADHIIATKTDLYGLQDRPNLHGYLAELNLSGKPVTCAQKGQINASILLARSHFNQQTPSHVHTGHGHPVKAITAPDTGSIKVKNSGEGYYSYGWICSPSETFDFETVMDTLSSLSVERLKATLITEKGLIACNYSEGCLSINIIQVEDPTDSRLEFLTQNKVLAAETCQTLEAAFNLTSSV